MKFAGCDWLPDVVPWSGQIDVSHMTSFTRSDGHRKLLGNQLGLGGLNALSELALAGVRRDAAVGGDADPGIELARIDRRPLRGAAPRPARARTAPGLQALKQTTSAPEPLRNSRRPPSLVRADELGVQACRHAVFSRYCLIASSMRSVGEAAAQHAGHRLLNLGVGRLGILIEERLCREDDAVQAEPALRRLIVDEGALQRMR